MVAQTLTCTEPALVHMEPTDAESGARNAGEAGILPQVYRHHQSLSNRPYHLGQHLKPRRRPDSSQTIVSRIAQAPDTVRTPLTISTHASHPQVNIKYPSHYPQIFHIQWISAVRL